MYKVGDKVRVTKKGSHEFQVGEVVELLEKFENKFPKGSHHWEAKSLSREKETWFLIENEFEAISKETTKLKEYTQYQKKVLKEELKEQRLNYEQREL